MTSDSWGLWLGIAGAIAATGIFLDQHELTKYQPAARRWLQRQFHSLETKRIPIRQLLSKRLSREELFLVFGYFILAILAFLGAGILQTFASALWSRGGFLVLLALPLYALAMFLGLIFYSLVIVVFLSVVLTFFAVLRFGIRLIVQLVRAVLQHVFGVASDPNHSPFKYASGLLSLAVVWGKIIFEIVS